MKKQRAFATLTEVEINQIADWLIQGQTYQTVLDRIRKPRSEGGFDLKISRSPLERLHAKKMIVNKINVHIESGQKLTLAQFDAIEAGETSTTEKVHHAIMETTRDLATSGDNSPAQLLALQRLADFPARAELRENREQRHAEMHEHKIEMDQFRKEMARQRLELAQLTFAFRQKQHQDRLIFAREKAQSKNEPAQPKNSDHLGPFATNLDEVSERLRIQFGVSKEEWARRTTLTPEDFDDIATPGNFNLPAFQPDNDNWIPSQTYEQP